MGVALLDSSTVIGFLDASDVLHVSADAGIRRAGGEHMLAVSVVTIAEVLAGAKLGHHDEDAVQRFFARSIARRFVLDELAAKRAAGLRAAYRSLKMPDALILATADLHADVVLTGDERWLDVADLSCVVQCVLPRP
jgi:predicted nucleic acid-binding protein